jgi:tetratricopeptide (TPR) repeat protein
MPYVPAAFRTLAICAFAVAIVLAAGQAWAIAGVDYPTYSLQDTQAVIDSGDFQRALPMLEEFLRFEPENPEAHNLMGYTLRNLGQLDAAMQSYNTALGFDPGHKGTLEYQGELFLKLNDKAAAEQNLAKLKELCPTGCEAHDILQAAIERFKDGDFAWTQVRK